jgi:hypothetical protein
MTVAWRSERVGLELLLLLPYCELSCCCSGVPSCCCCAPSAQLTWCTCLPVPACILEINLTLLQQSCSVFWGLWPFRAGKEVLKPSFSLLALAGSHRHWCSKARTTAANQQSQKDKQASFGPALNVIVFKPASNVITSAPGCVINGVRLALGVAAAIGATRPRCLASVTVSQ